MNQHVIRPLLPKATPLIRPDFRCTEIAKYMYYKTVPLKRGYYSYKVNFVLQKKWPKRDVFIGWSGLIRDVFIGWSGLIRDVFIGWSGLMGGVLWMEWPYKRCPLDGVAI